MNQKDQSAAQHSFAERLSSIPNEAMNAWSAAARAAGDIAEQSVKQGYSVIEEQIKRGKDTARQSSASDPGSTSAGASASRLFDPLGISDAYRSAFSDNGDSGTPDMSHLISRMAKTTVDLSALCLQFSNSVIGNPQAVSAVSEFWKNAGLAMNTATAKDASESGVRADGSTSTVPRGDVSHTRDVPSGAGLGIVVNSTGPTNASVQLFSGINGRRLTTHGLHSKDSSATPLRDVSFSDGRLIINVPDGQMPGLYTGVLIEETGGHVGGTVSVEIGAATSDKK